MCIRDRHIFVFFFQAEDGIRDVERSRGLGDVYKRQAQGDAPAQGGAQAQGGALEKGTVKKASDGQDYEWAGAQWISKSTGRIATKDVAAELTPKAPAGGSDLGKDMQIDIPTLADVIAKAGVQKAVKDQLGKEIKQPATA